MKIVVTGGAGFIGSNVVDELISNNHEVSVVDNLSTGKIENLNNEAKFYKCDITNIEALKLVFEFEKPEVVYHFAAQINVQTSLKNPAFDANINIVGTVNVLECCGKYEVKKIIYPSSVAIYDNKVKPVYKKQRQGDILYSYLDNTLAKKFLGWNTEYDFENGVRETINYYKDLFILNKKVEADKIQFNELILNTI